MCDPEKRGACTRSSGVALIPQCYLRGFGGGSTPQRILNLNFLATPVNFIMKGRNRVGRVTLTDEPLTPQDQSGCRESPVLWPFAFLPSAPPSFSSSFAFLPSAQPSAQGNWRQLEQHGGVDVCKLRTCFVKPVALPWREERGEGRGEG